MWLTSLRRLIIRHFRSRPTKHARPQRRRILPRLDPLEDRTLLSSGGLPYATPNTTAQLIADINAANSAGGATTITLASGATFDFTAPYQATNNALPVITGTITIEGNNATLLRDSSASSAFRLFEVATGATLTLQNLTLTGGLVTGSTAKGGAVYNSGGNLSMKSVVVAGNQAIGGVGQNAAGGGIYSSGGSLTLSHDVIGRTVKKSQTTKISLSTYTRTTKHSTKTIGASNKAVSGTGGSAMGAGLYVAGGVVNVSSCTIAGNQLSGSLNAQGGGLYVSGVASLHLHNDIVGRQSVQKITLYPLGVTQTSQATAYSLATHTSGSANTVSGGSAMGGGLYVAGGVVSLSGGVIGNNQVVAGVGQNAAGGGVYAVGASLMFNTVKLSNNQLVGGAAPAVVGGQGGNIQGGGLFLSGGSATLTNSLVTSNAQNVHAGAGGIGGNGGNAQGGGIYAVNTTLTLTGDSHVDRNTIVAGQGGKGTAHHLAAGQGGNAQGGGIYASNSTLVLSEGSTLDANLAEAGKGGIGGEGLVSPLNATANQPGATPGGQGGNGGLGQGGGLYANGGSVTIRGANSAVNNPAVNFNEVQGGAGGRGGRGSPGVAHGQTGGVGGTGGLGGEGDGGGIYLTATLLTVSGDVTLNNNIADGGTGGAGGPGGMGWSANVGTRGTLKSSFGGNGGNGGAGGAGGAAQGGGLFAVGSSGLTLSLGDAKGSFLIANNQVNGGHGGNGQAGDVGVGASAFYIGHAYRDGRGGNGGDGGKATGGGAAIYGYQLTLTNAVLQGNGIQGGGGGTNTNHYPFYDSSASASVGASGGGGSAVGGAGGSGQGGGLYVSGSSSVVVLNSTLADNSANLLDKQPNYNGQNSGNGGNGGNGGKNYATNNDSQMHGGNGGNGGTQQGGGLYATSSNLTVLNSTIADNALYDALGGAGGTGAQGNGTAGANGSSQGSGIFAANGSLSLLNDTLAWNFLYPTAGTVSPNDQGVGIFNAPSNVLTLENTLVALNQIYNATTATSTPSDLYGAAAPSSHNNFLGDGSGSSGLSNGSNGNQVGTDASPLNPLFAAPAPTGPGQGQEPGNYGGPTPTLPLDGKSPALNAGDPSAASIIAQYENGGLAPATDQRGLPRLVNGAIDIGATEDQVIFTGSPSVTSVQEGGTITYTLTVTNGEGAPIDVTLTDVIPADTSYDPGSASGTGWTITGPSASNNNTLTATTTLAPGATATLTFSVTVAPNAGNTTIHNSASINWTGNDASGTPSVLMNTTVTGGQSSTTTSLTSSANPAQYGQPVTFTAVVRASSGTPTGTVTFEDGNTVLGTAALDYNGVATFTISTLSLGSHSITAVYSGDSNDLGSTSNAVSLTINQDSTTTTLTSSANPAVYGQPVTFTATVSSLYSTPTGTVTFEDGNTVLGTVALSNGVAVFSTSTLPAGSNNITAVYSGDAYDAGSSGTFTQQVDYQFSGFLPPLSKGHAFEINRTIPIKFQLSDYNGQAITSLRAVASLQIQALDANGNPVGAPFTPASADKQGLQYTDGHYQFNWKTKGLSAGLYEIVLTLADGTIRTQTIQLTAHGCSAGSLTDSSDATDTNGAVLTDGGIKNSNGERPQDALANPSLSLTDQLFADLALLNKLVLERQADAGTVQYLDALLGLETSRMGTFKNATMFDLLFTDQSASS